MPQCVLFSDESSHNWLTRVTHETKQANKKYNKLSSGQSWRIKVSEKILNPTFTTQRNDVYIRKSFICDAIIKLSSIVNYN